MTTTNQLNALALRRLLNMLQLVQADIDFMKECPLDGRIKDGMRTMTNAIRRYLNDMRLATTPQTWNAIYNEMSSEKVKDISLCLDLLFQIENVQQVTDAIERVMSEIN